MKMTKILNYLNQIGKPSGIEYLMYFLLAVFSAVFSYLSRGIFGTEHLLSAWQVSLGHMPYIDFFEHHGPLQYSLFAPFFHFGGYGFFAWWLIIINSLIALLGVKYFFSLFELKLKSRIALAVIIIWLWTALLGFSFLPEPYIALFVILGYLSFLKVGKSNKYFAVLGIFIGLLFLIKFTVAIFFSFGLFAYFVLNFRRERELIRFKNFLYLSAGFILPILFLVAVYLNNFRELFYWMFTYNFEVVAPLARDWPPHPLSLFFLILAVNISILGIIFFNKNYRDKYYKFAFPIISSTCLLLVAYPRYWDCHLLPASVGFLVAIVLFFKEEMYKSIISFVSSRKNLAVNIFLSLLLAFIFLSACYSMFGLFKLTFRTFWSSPSAYYYGKLDKNDVDYIENKEQCNYIYIYPAGASNQLMYFSLLKEKTIKFLYPNFSWVFTNEIQKMILQDLKAKHVDCILASVGNPGNELRSEMIESYIAENYSRKGEVTWRVYGYRKALPFESKYELFKINLETK